jgi:hypothetical protein
MVEFWKHVINLTLIFFYFRLIKSFQHLFEVITSFYLFMAHFKTLPICEDCTESNIRMLNELWTEEEEKKRDRGIIRDTIPVFVWKYCRKRIHTLKPVWIVCVAAEIRIGPFHIWVRSVNERANLLGLEGQKNGYKTDLRKSQVGISGKRCEQPRSMLMIKKLVLLAKTRNSTSCRGGRLWQCRPVLALRDLS